MKERSEKKCEANGYIMDHRCRRQIYMQTWEQVKEKKNGDTTFQQSL